jgi:hypothetical protein
MAPPIPSCPGCGSKDDVEILESPVMRAGVELRYACWAPVHGQGYVFEGADDEWARDRAKREKAKVPLVVDELTRRRHREELQRGLTRIGALPPEVRDHPANQDGPA